VRIACVLIPALPLAVELLERPALRGQPLIVAGAPEEAHTVLACSAEAAAAGVRSGMPLRSARAFCREGLFLAARPAIYHARHERMLDALAAISPLVEAAEPGCAYVGLDGLVGMPRAGVQALFPDEGAAAVALAEAAEQAIALRPQVGVAGGRFAARAAALAAPAAAPLIVAATDAAPFLAPLPVELLPFAEPELRRLAWLGLRTLGDLAALPRTAVAAQFGATGDRAWALTQGIDPVPLAPRRPPAELCDQLTFPRPVVEAQAVIAAARHVLIRLLRRPERAARAARGLTLALTLDGGGRWERRLTLHEPTADGDRLLRLLAARLDGASFPAAVEALTLVLHDLCGETGLQGSLFTSRGRQLPELRTALAQLCARFGRPAVQTIVGVEPWSRLPERQYALIDYDPSTSHGPFA